MINNSAIIISVLIFFLILENLFPLRKRRDHFKRFLHNIFLAIMALPITRLLTLPLVLWVAQEAAEKDWGILNALNLNPTIHRLLSFLLLDGTLYWWHWANHRISFFWRFHQVHHADRDMDSTTALRFHFGELILAAFVRCALILIFGFRVEIILLFDLLVTSAALFHHSNFKLPLWGEKVLSLIIVTPLYHQNHHSYYLEETDSNYSTIFCFWDRLFHSFTRPNRADDITIGNPALSSGQLHFVDLIKMPFRAIRKWPEHLQKRN